MYRAIHGAMLSDVKSILLAGRDRDIGIGGNRVSPNFARSRILLLNSFDWRVASPIEYPQRFWSAAGQNKRWGLVSSVCTTPSWSATALRVLTHFLRIS